MSQKRWVIALLCSFLLGAIISFVLFPHESPPSPTQEEIEQLRTRLDVMAQRMQEIDDRVTEEVKNIRGKVRKDVESLPPDAVASGLNAELSGFGRVEGSPGGVDKP